MSLPCFVITVDRVTYLQRCLTSLENADLDIHLVDHGSTWEPMLEFLDSSPYPVHRRKKLLPWTLWEWETLPHIVGNRPYLVTDPDIELDPGCPSNWIEELTSLLHLQSYLAKAGLGLRIDDLPDTDLGHAAREWEKQFWTVPFWNGRHWSAPVDTTLALYHPLQKRSTFALAPSGRLNAPYLIRHLPWYEALDDTEEKRYYQEHLIPGASFWNTVEMG